MNAQAFAQLCRSRVSARAFKAGAGIPGDVLRRVLEVMQSAPSSFNLQPYKVVVVKSEAQREALAGAMLSPSNAKRVRDAPVTVVFAADRDPSQLTRRLMELETAHGTDPAYVSGLPSKVTFLLGPGVLSKAFRVVASHLLSPLAPSPKISPTLEGWACKNAALAAGVYMLAAQSHGLATAPMEGFDERRVGFLLGIPAERYSIPLLICTGYAAAAEGNADVNSVASASEVDGPAHRRFPLAEVACLDHFGVPLK